MENLGVYNGSSANLKQNPDLLARVLLRAKQGDEIAFSELYDLYFYKIYKFIYFRVGHKQVAEDLCEDAFIKAYKKLASLSNDHSFEGWLYKIARNIVVDYYRHKKQTVSLEEIENTLEYETNLVDSFSLQEEQRDLLKLIKLLNPEQQTVLKLKFFEDLENKEIAEILNKSEGAIRVIQHRAIAKIQTSIQENPQILI